MSGWGWWGNSLEGKIQALLDRLDNGKALGGPDDYRAAIAREFPVG